MFVVFLESNKHTLEEAVYYAQRIPLVNTPKMYDHKIVLGKEHWRAVDFF